MSDLFLSAEPFLQMRLDAETDQRGATLVGARPETRVLPSALSPSHRPPKPSGRAPQWHPPKVVTQPLCQLCRKPLCFQTKLAKPKSRCERARALRQAPGGAGFCSHLCLPPGTRGRELGRHEASPEADHGPPYLSPPYRCVGRTRHSPSSGTFLSVNICYFRQRRCWELGTSVSSGRTCVIAAS